MAPPQTIKAFTNSKMLSPADYTAVYSSVGYYPEKVPVDIKPAEPAIRNVELKEEQLQTERSGGNRGFAGYRVTQQPGAYSGAKQKRHRPAR
jgi:hypothetical protein